MKEQTYKVMYDDSPEESAFSAIYAANVLLDEHNLMIEVDDGEMMGGDGYIIHKVTLKIKP